MSSDACQASLYFLTCAQDLSVRQSWFAHFYAVGTVSNMAVLALLSGMLGKEHEITPDMAQLQTLAALILLQLHLSRRLIESWVVFQYPADARMHFIAYLFGIRCVPCSDSS